MALGAWLMMSGCVGQLYADNFNRADSSTMGSKWTSSSMQIVSNEAYSDQLSAATAWTTALPSQDMYVQATVRATATEWSLIGRCANGSVAEYIKGGWRNGTGWWFRQASTTIASTAASAPSAGTVIRFELQGTALTLYADGVEVLSSTSSTFNDSTHRRAGLFGGGDANQYDDWSAGSL